MKITIDEKTCIGCGMCESMCEECFKLENSVAIVINDECERCDLQDVADNCPVQAIKIEK